MAGDLLIENISFDQQLTLVEAGGIVGTDIFHADKPWRQYKPVLDQRLVGGGPNRRADLPAHAYITFNASNRAALEKYCNDGVKKARLSDLLKKCTRPLGVVSANVNLAHWPGESWDGPANSLMAALTRGNVIIEYYKVDGSPILDVHRDWKQHDE
jgi:hypothetical protein